MSQTNGAKDTKPRYRLLKNYYSRADYFRHDINKGSIRTPTGERICALTGDFLIGFHKAVEFECGKATGQIFKTAGRRWGKQFTERFDRDLSAHYRGPLKDLSTALVYDSLTEAFRHHGWGKVTFHLADIEFGLIIVEVANSVMPAVLGKRSKQCDHLMAGFLASFFAFYAGMELDAQQVECSSRGASASAFVIGPGERLQNVPDWVEQGLNRNEIMNRLRLIGT